MNVHVCALSNSSLAMIIYVFIGLNFSFYLTSGEAFQQSLITHHKFYNQAAALVLAS